METSRDDFIIAIRSAFLKKGTQQRFSLLGLILFSLIFLILGNLNFKVINYVKIGINEIVYKVSFIASIPENFIKNTYLVIQDHNNLYTKNKKNVSELEKMKSENISKKIIEFENIRLKQMIDDYFIKNNEIFAKVLIDKKSPFLRSIVLNKGSKNNIKLGMAVLDDIYFIGKVVEVNHLSSRVLLVSDINSKIPVLIEPNNIQAIMSGNGFGKGIIEYINEANSDSEIENSIVFTSGMGGLFKSGIPIGKINKKNQSLNYDSIVTFHKNLSQLKYVKVLSYKKENLYSTIQTQKKISITNKENVKNLKNKNSLLKVQMKISDEIRIKLADENILLNVKLSKLKKEISIIKKNQERSNNIINNNKILNKEKNFLELNTLYKKKCKKTIFNKLYKVGTAEYKDCILNKGKI